MSPAPLPPEGRDGPLAAARGPLAVVALFAGLALLLAGCAATPADQCETARVAVAAYDAANAAGERIPSKEEAIAAAIARAVLASRCGP